MFLKKWIGAAIQGHKMRSVDYAANLGVPRDFSIKIMNEHTMITKVVKELGRQDPNLAIMDVYEQYGIVLKVMYGDFIDNQTVHENIEINTSESSREVVSQFQNNDRTHEKSNFTVDNCDYWIDSLIKWADENAISEKDLPRDHDKLVNMKELFLLFYDFKKLPPEIGKLNNLEKLSIVISGLSVLPPEICELHNLHELDLGRNILTELPIELSYMSSLKIVDDIEKSPSESTKEFLERCGYKLVNAKNIE